MEQEKEDAFGIFAEEMKTKAVLCLPASYADGCMDGRYSLEYKLAAGRYRMQFSDGREHISEMPYLDVVTIFEACNGRFDTKKVRDYLKNYINLYETAVRKEEKEQKRLANLMKIFPSEWIVTMLIPSETGMKERFVGREYRNAFQIYSVMVEEGMDSDSGCERILTSVVTPYLMGKWEVSEKELFEAARRHMPRLFPYEIEKIQVSGIEAYIVGTAKCSFGTGTLFYQEGPLKEIAAEVSSDLYLFPLSVHEVAVFPENGFFPEMEIITMADKVSPFGGGIWYYNRSLNQLAFSKEERYAQKMQMKDGIMDAAERREIYAAIG